MKVSDLVICKRMYGATFIGQITMIGQITCEILLIKVISGIDLKRAESKINIKSWFVYSMVTPMTDEDKIQWL
jgi:hypothetical protein